MTTWHATLIPVALVIMGLLRQSRILHEKNARLALAKDFLDRFISWYKDRGRDRSAYNWMVERSDTVQAMLGRSGVMGITDRLRGLRANNWPIVLNALPEINHAFSDRDYGSLSPMSRRTQRLVQGVEHSLRRFIGSTQQQLNREKWRLFNPIVLFCGGVALVLELPLFILSEFKIISTTRRVIIANGKVFSLLSGVMTIATLVATLMTIVLGWDRFLEVLERFSDMLSRVGCVSQ